jgi:hypothetical protein
MKLSDLSPTTHFWIAMACYALGLLLAVLALITAR